MAGQRGAVVDGNAAVEAGVAGQALALEGGGRPLDAQAAVLAQTAAAVGDAELADGPRVAERAVADVADAVG